EKICLDPGARLTVETSQLAPTVDTSVYIWDPATNSAVAANDDAVPGAPESRATYTNGAARRCVSIVVMNQRPLLAGKARVTRTVEAGGTRQDKVLEVQLRSYPTDLAYGAADVDFEVAMTRYTDLPGTPTTLPLALFRGSELVGFDYDS